MSRRSLKERLRQTWRKLLRKPVEPPEDPYAYVGAPKKPRPPLRGAAVAERPE